MAETLPFREFLVELGWHVDEQGFKKFLSHTLGATHAVTELGEGVVASAAAIVTAVKLIANKFTDLYYSSQVIGGSVEHITELQFAVERAGVPISELNGILETMGEKLHRFKGLQTMLRGGVWRLTGDLSDPTVVLPQIIKRLSEMTPEQRSHQALPFLRQNFGIGYATMEKFAQNAPAILAAINEAAEDAKKSGVDKKKLAELSKTFNDLLASINEQFNELYNALAINVLPYLIKFGGWFKDFMSNKVLPFVGEHPGLSIAGLLGAGWVGKKLGGWLLGRLFGGLFGKTIATAVAEAVAAAGVGTGAAGGAAAVVGGRGLLAGLLGRLSPWLMLLSLGGDTPGGGTMTPEQLAKAKADQAAAMAKQEEEWKRTHGGQSYSFWGDVWEYFTGRPAASGSVGAQGAIGPTGQPGAGGWASSLVSALNPVASASAATTPTGDTGTGRGRAQMLFSMFRGMGMTAEQANGAIAGLMGESTKELKPGSLNPNDPGGAYGMGQWILERKDALMAYAKKQGKPWNDPLVQAGFLKSELTGRYGYVLRAMLAAKSEEEALAIWVKQFEVPRDKEGESIRRRAYLPYIHGLHLDAPPPGASGGNVQQTNHVNIHVNGSADPQAVGKSVINDQHRVLADLIRGHYPSIT